MSESYTLLLNSLNPKNQQNFDSANGDYNITYYINWASFLPQEYKRFRVISSLKSATSTSLQFSGQTLIKLSLVSSFQNFDQTWNTIGVIGTINPKSSTIGATTQMFYFDSDYLTINDFIMDYPKDNFLNVLMASQGLTGNIKFPDYLLKLKFIPIVD